MTAHFMPTVAGLYRYPVKGLSPEPLAQAELKPGEAIPFDRMYAIENGPGRFDPAVPKHLPKIAFLMLMRNERLATLATHFEPATSALTISRGGMPVAQGDMSTEHGRQMIEQFFASFMAAELRGRPRIVMSPGHSFSDVADKVLHVVNLASVRELERRAKRTIDPLRFRANLYLDGLPAWVEADWIGGTLQGSSTTLGVTKATDRCAATNVDPTTGDRDMAIPELLQRERGTIDFGVYARVTTPGVLKVGETLNVV